MDEMGVGVQAYADILGRLSAVFRHGRCHCKHGCGRLCCFVSDLRSKAFASKRKCLRARKTVKSVRVKNLTSMKDFNFSGALKGILFLTGGEKGKIKEMCQTLLKMSPSSSYSSVYDAMADLCFDTWSASQAWGYVSRLLFKIMPFCPKNVHWEKRWIRMATWAVFLSDWKSAKAFLCEAGRSLDPKEKVRYLFWMGFLHQKDSGSSTENKYWNELVVQYPLSFFSVLASGLMGRDPLDSFAHTESVVCSRSAGKGFFNRVALVFDLLFASGQFQHAVQWSSWLTMLPYFKSLDHAQLLYLALAHQKVGNMRGCFSLLSQRSMDGAKTSLDLLYLLFPRMHVHCVFRFSKKFGLEPNHVFALIRQESAFDPKACSVAGARGLMQILPKTACSLGCTCSKHLFDPVTNVRFGVQYLDKLKSLFRGNLVRVFASYNAGFTSVRRWMENWSVFHDLLFMEIIPYEETRNYIAFLLRNSYWYARLYPEDQDTNSLFSALLSQTYHLLGTGPGNRMTQERSFTEAFFKHVNLFLTLGIGTR